MMRYPEVFAKAWTLLKQERPGLSLSEDPPESHRLILSFDVAPNAFGVPSAVCIELVWDENFPYGSVDVYSKTPELKGFWHQMAGDGKLCLERSIAEISDETLLLKTVRGVEDWLDAMSKGRLANNGEVYELPDFGGVSNIGDYSYSHLIYVEDEERYRQFCESRNGFCKLLKYVMPKVLRPTEFTKGEGVGARIPDVECQGLGTAQGYFMATWVQFPQITIINNRPPQTWSELFTLAESSGIPNFKRLIRKAWEQATGDEVYFLVGWPIPRRIGYPKAMMAWRAFVFHSLHYIRHAAKHEGYVSRRTATAGNLWRLSEPGGGRDSSINWLVGENISYEGMTARWKLGEALTDKKVALVGCGALGSILAELLVRGGLRQLTLVDGDTLEFGNLCRHTLSSTSVLENKAKALACQLLRACPLSKVTWNAGSTNGTEDSVWGQYDLVLDCTAHDKLTFPLAVTLRKQNVRYIKLFINGNAKYLTIASSGRYIRCDVVLVKLFEKLHEQENFPDIIDYFDAEPLVSVMAPGCWHPTYPGRWNNIVSLVGTAMPLIERLTKGSFETDGHATVYRFAEGSAGLPEIKVVFNEDIA